MGEIVSYRGRAGTSDGYLAVPESVSGPAVIVIQEWWGMVPHIRSLAQRFAGAGFVCLAPDLYDGRRATEPDEAGRLLMGLAMDEAAKEIASASDYLAGLDVTSASSVSVVGFGLGGSLALWSATRSERIRSTVGFYPTIPWDRSAPEWTNYDGKAALIHCSEPDGPRSGLGILQAESAIEAAGGKCTVYDYPSADYAFFNDDRPEVYDADAAAVAWARTLDFLRAQAS